MVDKCSHDVSDCENVSRRSGEFTAVSVMPRDQEKFQSSNDEDFLEIYLKAAKSIFTYFYFGIWIHLKYFFKLIKWKKGAE